MSACSIPKAMLPMNFQAQPHSHVTQPPRIIKTPSNDPSHNGVTAAMNHMDLDEPKKHKETTELYSNLQAEVCLRVEQDFVG